MLTPISVFKCLADETRLRALLLIRSEGELCVCEISSALELSQPKVSRHLAQLRSCGLVAGERHEQWIYYNLHPDLPQWVHEVLLSVMLAQQPLTTKDRERLKTMGDRPERQAENCH